jgi:hypothetical protein
MTLADNAHISNINGTINGSRTFTVTHRKHKSNFDTIIDFTPFLNRAKLVTLLVEADNNKKNVNHNANGICDAKTYVEFLFCHCFFVEIELTATFKELNYLSILCK